MSQTALFEGLCAVALIVATALLGLYFVSVSRELGQARRETSRFPLFAVRRRLVQLVAEGKIKEDDPAWQSLYARVNFLLRMDQRLDALDLVARYSRSQLEVDNNPRVRTRFEHIRRLEREATARVPEFAEVVRETEGALLYLVHRRTTRLHLSALLFVVVVGRIVVAALAGGLSSARAVQRAVVHPSADDFIKWQAVDGDRLQQLGSA